ncbi:MAG: hypothetical protein WA191_24320 [Telluria sp.]|nr:hypothetical protein [Telluria sp.]
MRAYLALFCCVCTLALTGVAGLNYMVDPYLTHQWDSPLLQRLRPSREKLSAWGKTYALARYRPDVLYLGNSRTELALPVRLPVFSGAAVFNGALSGASLGDAVAMAGHARALKRLGTVVWGLDAPSFSMLAGATDFDRDLVAAGGHYFAWRGLLDLKRALTLDMTRDSLAVLAGSFGAVCRSSLAFFGQRDDSCMADRTAGWRGTAEAVAPRLGEFMRGAGPTPDALTGLDDMLAQLCRDGTRVRLYINPTHASTLDALYWRGKGGALERWQASLAVLAAERRTAGCDLRLFDFSGFNAITTEALPQASGRREMAYYWEPSHYRVNVGRMIMQRLFGGEADPAPPDFGVELEPPMMAAHLARQREGRARYHAEHALEAALARSLAEAEGAPKPAR